MRTETITMKLSRQEDFPQIHELLIKSELPIAGVDSKKGNYYIAGEQEIIGVIGVEQYGLSAMLRSLAVEPQFRNAGVARKLIEYALQVLKGSGVTDIYLMTNTAEKYLTRYGFVKVERGKIPENLLAVSALGDACPASSTCMHLLLSK